MTGDSGWAVRPTTEADWPAVLGVDVQAFGRSLTPERAELDRNVYPHDRGLGAFDRDLLVGIAAAFSLQLSVPAPADAGQRCAYLPVAGVTWVSVLPTHRRRGVLTALMREQLHGLHAAAGQGVDGPGGEAVAALGASEPGIYGRFGYGLAARSLRLTVPRSARALLEHPGAGAAAGSGQPRLRLAAPADVWPLTEPVHEALGLRRPGLARRTEIWRRALLHDPPGDRGGSSDLRCVVAEDDGGVRGYAHYRIERRWEAGSPAGVVHVNEALALDPAAELALWRYLLDIDLTTSVEVRNRPVDDPLLEMLADSRRARPALQDSLYMRLVDLDRALAQRGYAAELDLVFDVRDELCPWNAGRWQVTAGAGAEGAASVRRSSAAPDLALSARELGSVYLGGASVSQLVGAGRIQECRAGAAAQLDRAFRTDPGPWPLDEF